MMDAGGASSDCLHPFHLRVEKTLPQHTLPHHSCRAKDQDFHRYASRFMGKVTVLEICSPAGHFTSGELLRDFP